MLEEVLRALAVDEAHDASTARGRQLRSQRVVNGAVRLLGGQRGGVALGVGHCCTPRKIYQNTCE